MPCNNSNETTNNKDKQRTATMGWNNKKMTRILNNTVDNHHRNCRPWFHGWPTWIQKRCKQSPYVPTPEKEVLDPRRRKRQRPPNGNDANASATDNKNNNDTDWIAAAWAGGTHARQVVDRLVRQLAGQGGQNSHLVTPISTLCEHQVGGSETLTGSAVSYLTTSHWVQVPKEIALTKAQQMNDRSCLRVTKISIFVMTFSTVRSESLWRDNKNTRTPNQHEPGERRRVSWNVGSKGATQIGTWNYVMGSFKSRTKDHWFGSHAKRRSTKQNRHSNDLRTKTIDWQITKSTQPGRFCVVWDHSQPFQPYKNRVIHFPIIVQWTIGIRVVCSAVAMVLPWTTLPNDNTNSGRITYVLLYETQDVPTVLVHVSCKWSMDW